MDAETKQFKQEISVTWVKGESGSTYLCPTAALNRIDNPTEADLKAICVDESNDPHNS